MRGWTSYGDGVYAKRYASLDLNIGAVVCGDGILIVDTRAHRAQALELAADLQRLTPHRVRWVVNTHHHWDHTFGNAVFRPAAIWGHARCAETLRERGEAMRQQLKKWAPDQADLFDEVEIVPPDHTLLTEAIVTFGGRDVRIRHLGRGHTDNDVVVEIPDAGVVFAGDLVEQGNPPAFQDSFPLEWPETVSRLLPLISGPVIPGHGAAVDHGFVAQQQRELAAVAELARERHAAGLTPARAAAAEGPFPTPTLEHAFIRAWPALESAG